MSQSEGSPRDPLIASYRVRSRGPHCLVKGVVRNRRHTASASCLRVRIGTTSTNCGNCDNSASNDSDHRPSRNTGNCSSDGRRLTSADIAGETRVADADARDIRSCVIGRIKRQRFSLGHAPAMTRAVSGARGHVLSRDQALRRRTCVFFTGRGIDTAAKIEGVNCASGLGCAPAASETGSICSRQA